MEQRDIKYFEERLEKDNYSKEEVAKITHNESQFTSQQLKKEFNGMVSKEDYDSITTELNLLKDEIKPFKENAFNKSVNTEFSKLNGLDDRISDFTSIAKLTGSETTEEIATKVSEFKNNEKYGFLFKSTDSGIVKSKQDVNTPTKTPVRGAITPKIGWNPFKSNK